MVSSPRIPLWREEAEEVESAGPEMLSLSKVAEVTGLRTATVMAAVHSTAHGGRSRLRSLSRPRYSVHGVPYWAPEQAADYHAAQAHERRKWTGLPVVDADEAVAKQYTSLHGLSRVSGVPVGTLHRWKGSGEFPSPVALMDVGSSSPRLLYSWPEVRTYMQHYRLTWIAKRGADLSGRVTSASV